MEDRKKETHKTKKVVKAKASPSITIVPEPALGKSFPRGSSQHAVQPQSPPTTPSKEKPDDIIAYVHHLSFKTNVRP